MRKRTTTKQLLEAITTKGLLEVIKVECSHKSSSRIDEMDKGTFLDNLAFINESGIFAGFIDWHYESGLPGKDGYTAGSGAMNPYTENVVTVYMEPSEGVTEEGIAKALHFEEMEE